MRALVLDDHDLFRAGFSLLLEQLHPGIEVVQATSLQDGLEHALTEKLDIAFVDLELRSGDGFAALSELERRGVPVLAMTEHRCLETKRQCMQRGAAGYLAKTKSSEVVDASLRAVLSGLSAYSRPSPMYALSSISSDIELKKLVTSVAQNLPLRGAYAIGLTLREFETLKWLIQGLSNKAIANEMGIEETTVRVYVSRLLAHFHVPNRGTLIRLILTRGDANKRFGTDDDTPPDGRDPVVKK